MGAKLVLGGLQAFLTLPHASFSERHQPVTVTAGCLSKAPG